MATSGSILLLVTVWASIQDGWGLPVVKQLDSGVPAAPVRTRRCACSNQLDSECHYFCHLDIIWINTPSKTTLYGLGGSMLRRKRSTGRCTCTKPDDQTCKGFCSLRPEATTITSPHADMLDILRAAAKKSQKALDAQRSDGYQPPQAQGKIA
ncbi:endothelin-2 [Kryptolebias marmoratus]|uniref:Endothelin-2-like n=1 Tax=Kryptolebias marmoratus TaxID=37003 RepID=A0A3Q3ANN4_KRYMA|nr:endothelin-2 [Kryptolebias marmoratus]